ncbi:MAG: amidohydrolase family protein [Novosphingobium sp.]
MAAMLIRRAELWQGGIADLRIAGGKVSAIGTLEPKPGETVIEASGGALLPGLHDHHIHLSASAVRKESIVCGPPQVRTPDALRDALAKAPGDSWLRGILYHESVMGLPDAARLDDLCRDRPLRIQHRSGRMWLFNSLALDTLLALGDPPQGMEIENGRYTGRLFDEDPWLRSTLASLPPAFGAISAELAAFGVTGLTDMSPSNDTETASHFASEARSGRLVQRYCLAGTLKLGSGPVKLHLHEAALPDFDEVVDMIRNAHDQLRPIASHCTTETELVFTLAAIEAAGARRGDRIEHAGIARDSHIAQIAEMQLAVVGQPHFIAERGDQYCADVEPDLIPCLYRQAAFLRAGVTLAAGSDAPFGSADPWAAMRAAVTRQTANGTVIGIDEELSPEQALALFLADPVDLLVQRSLTVGAPADLCLLSAPWKLARTALDASLVRATVIAGNLVHEAPVEGCTG